MDKFGERLKRAREKKGITAYILADLCDIPRSLVYDYETGKRIPRLDKAASMSGYLGVSLDYLAGLSEKP